jgi:hypothetical protein
MTASSHGTGKTASSHGSGKNLFRLEVVSSIVRDMRYALRRLVREWRFTTAAVLILGLGIGAKPRCSAS